MPVACVLVTHFAAKVELRRRPELRRRAFLVVAEEEQRKAVLDRSPEAGGVDVGMPLEHALARCPQASIVEADLPAYHDAWERVLDALEQRAPVVEDAGLGTAYMDLRGLESLYGGEAGLVTALQRAVPACHAPRVGVAQGRFPAYAAALGARAGGAVRVPDNAAAFLAPLPVTVLSATWEARERLMGFGLATLGDVAALPFSAMQAEFGREGARLWRLASGQDDGPLVPRRREESHTFEIAFEAPTVSLPAVLVALESLVARAFDGGPLRGRYACRAALRGDVLHGVPWTRLVVFREPVGSRDRAMLALRAALEHATPSGPLEALALTLSGITGEVGRQESLFQDVRRQANLDEALRQLRERLRRRPVVYRVREVEPWSRIPERRHALMPYEP